MSTDTSSDLSSGPVSSSREHEVTSTKLQHVRRPWWQWPWALPRPPGPRGLPWIGPLADLSRDTLGFLTRFGRDYGGIAYTRFGPIHAYMVSEPALIEEVLMGHHRDCMKDSTTRAFGVIAGQGLITSDGALWKKQRRLASPAMRPKSVAGYGDAAVRAAERLNRSLQGSEVRNIHADIMKLLIEVVGETLLGFEPGDDLGCLERVSDATIEYFHKENWALYQLLPAWVPVRHRRVARAAAAELDAVIYRVIERCRANPDPADHFLGHLCRVRDEHGQPMELRQLRDEAVTTLLAGHETTAIGLAFALYSLGLDPELAARLRGELASVLGDRRATTADLPNLPYLDAVVREALRLYPPVYVFGREVVAPFQLAGFDVPVGSQVIISSFVVQRDPRFFAEPGSFRPERWLNLDRSSLPRFAYFPFGGGPRVCIGQHYAIMQSSLILATMLQDLDLEPLADFELRFEPIVTLRPAGGYLPLRVSPRRRS